MNAWPKINGIPAEAHIGKRVHALMPELAEAVEPEMRRVLETGQPRLNIEIVSETPAQAGRQAKLVGARGCLSPMPMVESPA